MVTLRLQQEEMLAEKVKGFPVFYDKIVKGFKRLGESNRKFRFCREW